jgi:serine protease Do
MKRLRPLLGVALLLLLATGCPDRDAAPRVATPTGTGEGFRNVVQEVLPSIVFIQTEITPPPGIERLLPGIERLPDEPVPVGMGSGVLLTEDGYILTNNHVVQDAQRVRVVLHDRRYFDAVVVGRDPATEVAVVRIAGNGFPVARLGDSDAVGLGDWVLAMGSPLGLQFSVTAGIVSGTGRDIGILGAQMDPALQQQAAPLEHFIQTDAALSPGNSGGPLVNAAGEVIGINTAVATPRGTPASFGFAIPSNLARRVAEQLIQFGEVRRPFLGVILMNVNPALAEAQGLRTVEGAAVVRVEPGSPADLAGIRPEDVIVRIADRPVQTVSDLQAQLVQLDPGATVRVQGVRQGREFETSVELGMVRSGVVPGQ